MPTFSPYSNNAFSSLPHLRLPFPSTAKTTEAAANELPNSSGQKCRHHHQSCPELDGINFNHWPKSPSFHISSSPSALSALSSQNPSSSTASFHSFSPSPGSPNASHQSDFFLDQCPALLQQVPESFDLGMTPVRLSSLAASSSGHYMAIGSHCGALFLFNRRLGQAVKPLRTNYNEVATLLHFHSPSPSSSDGRDQLAVGHQSGILVLLALPSEGNQRFSQHVQEEAHRGSPLTAICWSPDGHSLFSGDHSGLLLAIRADFPNDHFPVNFVASEPLPIRSITAGLEKLAFSTAENCKIVNWKSGEYELIGQINFGENPILGMAFDSCEEGGEKLTLLTGDGTLLICQNADGNAAHELGNILNNLDPSQRDKWPFTDFSGANAIADPSGQSLVIWKDATLLLCRFMEGGFGMEIVDLRERIGDPNLQVVSICVPSQNELFLLANARRVFRLGRLCPASPSLTICPPAPASVPNIPVNIFGSLFAAGRTVGGELHKAGKRRAQGLLPTGTDQLLGKFNRELDIFLMGESGKNGGGMEMEEETEEEGNPKMDERNVKDERKKDEPAAIGLAEKLAAGFLPMPEPAERLAQGLQQLFGQIRQSSSIISAEFDHWSLAGTSRDLSGDNIGTSRGDNRSLPTELSPSMDEDREELISLLEDGSEEGGGGGRRWERRGEEEEDVRVKRRRIMQKRRGIGRKRPKEWGLRALAEERASKASALNLEEEEDEVEEQKNCEKEMNVNEDEEQKRMMEVLNGIMGNEEERKEREFDEKQRNEEEEDDGKKKANEAREENEEAFGIMETTKLSHEEEEEEEKRIMSSSNSSFPPDDHGEEGEEHESALASRPLAPSTILDLSDLLSNAPPAPSAPPSPPSDPHPPIISPPPSSFSPPPLAIRRCAIYQLVCRRQSTTDRWTRLECPFPIGHFAICRHYLVICPKKRASQSNRPHFLTIGSMRRPTTPPAAGQLQQHRWTPLRLHADGIVPNEDGTRIWRISNGIGYSPAHPPDPICPSWSLSKCAEWCEMTSQNEGKLLQVALNSRHAWYLTDRGVFVQMCLPESGVGIWFRAQGSEDDPPAQFGQIAVSECAVWALNTFGGMVVVRTGLRHCPMGLDWVEMDGQPRKFVAIGLFERTGFGLDPDGCIWFIHGVAPESPFGIGQWLKCPPIPSSLLTAASSSKLAPIAEWRLKVGSAGILLNVGPAILHTDFLSGSTFEHVVPEKLALNDHFGMLAATAFSGMANDCLFASAPPNGDLFLFSMRSRAFSPLLPSVPNIRSIWAMPEWLFLLDNFGIVHFRPAGGNGATGNMAEEWNNFGQPAKFCSFGASNSSLWAISQTPELAIWACRFRPLDGFGRLDWMEISGPSQQQGAKEKPDQIRVSPSGQSVWLFSSSSGLAWVRTDLAARNWRGRSWLLANSSASRIPIADLALSDDTAWALAKGNGQLYGLTNRPKCSSSSAFSFIWRPFNFHLTAISVDSLEGRLWALDKEYRLVRHQMDIFPRETRSEEEAEIAKEEEEIAKHNHKWTRENWNPDMTRMLRRAWELPERTLSGESADSWCDLGRGGAI